MVLVGYLFPVGLRAQGSSGRCRQAWAGHHGSRSRDGGVATCQALLTAFHEGLGACFSAFNAAIARELFNIPDEWVPLYVLLVGYPAESWEAGGQPPARANNPDRTETIKRLAERLGLPL